MSSMTEAPLDLSSCESEPIRIPGFIGPHGVLVALDCATFVVTEVSENSEPLLGIAPGDLIEKSPATFLGERQFEQLVTKFRAGPFEPNARRATITIRC